MLKDSMIKKIFIFIIILLLIIAIYILYKDGNEQKINIENLELKIETIDYLNVGIAKFDTINPILTNNRDVQYVDRLIFDSLVDITYDYKTENLLAKEVSKINSKQYLIKLKDTIYWHDGTKFTSKDVIFTIKNIQNDNVKTVYKENVKNIEQIQQIDEYTIKILLNEEVPFFEYMLCFPILASHAYQEGTLISNTEIPQGTGKYKITKISENSIQVERVQKEDNIKISQINLILTDSMKDLYTGLQKKEIDFIITDNIEYEKYIGTMGYNVSAAPNRSFEYLELNENNNLLSNKEIRRAIKYAIDRQAINYKVYNNKYHISDFPIDYGSYLFKNQNIFKYDINESKNILTQNEWTFENEVWKKKNKILSFDLVVKYNDDKRVLLAEEIKKQLEDIGIKINIVKVNEDLYNNYIKNENYDMILTGKIVSNSPNIENYFGEKEEILFNEIKNISDNEVLKQKYNELEQIYQDETPFISLYFDSIFVLSNTSLKGDFSYNWYNIFYNIDNWYKIKEN